MKSFENLLEGEGVVGLEFRPQAKWAPGCIAAKRFVSKGGLLCDRFVAFRMGSSQCRPPAHKSIRGRLKAGRKAMREEYFALDIQSAL